MKQVGQFEKVQEDVFIEDVHSMTLNIFKTKYRDIVAFKILSDMGLTDQVVSDIRKIYDGVELPKRATKGSCGYDFYAPQDYVLRPGESCLIPTGVRVKIDEGWALKIYPRSGLGFKHRVQLDNTVGLIDSDYYNAVNTGHIWVKLTANPESGESVVIKKGEAICQGVFEEFGITYDDNSQGIRTSGFGSTTGKTK